MRRREFFLNMIGLSGISVVAPFIFVTMRSDNVLAEESRRKKVEGINGDSEIVDPNEPTAKAVGYVEDFNKAPKAAGNKCATCILYVKSGTKKGKETGACTLFPKKVVFGGGFCNSWAKKA